jgi:hypothetical protein
MRAAKLLLIGVIHLSSVVCILLFLELIARSDWLQSRGIAIIRQHHAQPFLVKQKLSRDALPGVPWALADAEPILTMKVAGDWADYQKIQVSGPFWDKALMHLPKRRVNVQVHTHFSKQLVFNTSYSTDEMGRRMTVRNFAARRTRAVIFAGCSFIFGEGLEDKDTLPSIMQRNMSDVRVFNFGRSGSAPNSFLRAIEDPDYRFFDDITESEGVFIYNFIDDHISRSIGSMRRLRVDPSSWLMPDFDVSGKAPVFVGDFETSRSWLFKLTTYSKLATALDISFPIENQSALKYIAKLLYFVRQNIKLRKPNFRFIVLLHPHSSVYGPGLRAELVKHGIQSLDYSNLDMNSILPGRSVLLDGHPSRWSNEVVGQLLLSALFNH